MNDIEKLKAVSRTLSNIRLPAAFTESAIIPIYNSILVIEEVIKSPSAKNEDEPEIGIDAVDSVPEDQPVEEIKMEEG